MKGNKNAYSYRHGNEDEESAIDKMRKDIEANQDNALNLCTEKVLLARQAFDLVSFDPLSEFPVLEKSVDVSSCRFCAAV